MGMGRFVEQMGMLALHMCTLVDMEDFLAYEFCLG